MATGVSREREVLAARLRAFEQEVELLGTNARSGRG